MPDSTTRRRALRAGLLGLGAALAGCGGSGGAGGSGSASSTPGRTDTPTPAAYDRLVDAVEAGADPSGETSVNFVLENELRDDTRLHFPPGEYFLDPISVSGSNWALTGDDATIVVPNYVDRRYLALDGDGWTVEGVTVDLSAPSAAPTVYARGRDWTLRDVSFAGRMGDPGADNALLYPAVDSAGATGLVEGVRATDGSAAPGESSNHGLTWFGQNNRGRLTWRNCEFSGWANNTLYGANSAGELVVENCLFRDTNVGVRIGGETVVRGCTFDQRGPVPVQRWTGDANARGLWINSNQYTRGQILVEDCEFLMTGPDATTAVNGTHAVDDLVVRNCRIVQGNDRPAVSVPGGAPLRVADTTVTGPSSRPAVEVVDRDGTEVVGCCVRKPGTGVRIVDSTDCRVADTTLAVDGEAVSTENAEVSVEGVTREGDCAAPDWPDPAS
jgi:hypothetical protein